MLSASSSILSYLRVVTAAWRDDPRDDDALLDRFAKVRDEAAFATLVWRHGPLVWRTCRHILGETPDAEDAFQATFLSLARKAGWFPVESLAGWLHRTARRAALDAQAGAQRRRGLEQRLRALKQPEVQGGDADRAELNAALDEELAGLPEKLRVPLLLHYIEGRSQVEVARLLGCARSALQKRLAQGEAILRKQLERRGLTVGIVSVGVLLGSTAGAPAMPALLVGNTVRAAMAFRTGAFAGWVAKTELQSLSFPSLESSKIAALAERVMRTMRITKIKIIAALLGATLCVAGGSVLAYRVLAGNIAELPQPAGEPRGEVEASHQPGPGNRMAVRVDCYGDPLPEGALARLGTVRLRHPEEVKSVVFSPDGKTLASGGCGNNRLRPDTFDGTVRLWEAATGKEIRTLKGHQDGVTSVAFSSDGKTVASGGYDKTVRLWETATGKEIHTLRGHQGTIESVAFSPDGKIVASGSAGCAVRLWEAATGKEIRTLRGHTGGVFSVAFSSDGKTMASAGDGTVRLWEVATGKEIRTLKGHQEEVRSVAFSSDGKIVASGGRDNTVRLWEVATGKEIRTLKGHQGMVLSVAFSPDGKAVASGGEDGVIRQWDAVTGKEIRSVPGHQGVVASLAFLPDGKTAVSGGNDGTVRLWEVATGKEIRTLKGFQGMFWPVVFSPDRKTVASRSTGRNDKMVCLWEMATGKEIRTLKGHKDCVRSVAFSSDGKTLASAGDDGVVHLWEAATGKEIRTLKGEQGQIWSVAFSSDGKAVAAGSQDDGNVYLWEVATGKQTRILHGNQGVALSVSFSPDNKTVVSGGRNGEVCLWDVATGKKIYTLKGHQGMVWSVAFSPDGKTVASGGEDRMIRLWEMATGKKIRTLQGHQGTIYSVVFASDGRIFASASADSTGLVWDVTSLAWLKPMQGRPLSPPARFEKQQLEAAWNELADADPAKAYPALWKLTQSPAQTIALLRARLQPVATLPDPQQLKRWIADLDDDGFRVRDKAQREIEKLGEPVLPALRQALQGQLGLEARRRLQALLTELESKGFVVPVFRLRELRAVQVLEFIGTAEARQVLQVWAKGIPEAHLTVEAQAALDRLAKRSAARP